MKYLYKQTGTVVESSIPLDSAIFSPYDEKQMVTAEKTGKPARKTTKKPAAKTSTKAAE